MSLAVVADILIGLTLAAAITWAYICRPMFRRLREATQ